MNPEFFLLKSSKQKFHWLCCLQRKSETELRFQLINVGILRINSFEMLSRVGVSHLLRREIECYKIAAHIPFGSRMIGSLILCRKFYASEYVQDRINTKLYTKVMKVRV